MPSLDTDLHLQMLKKVANKKRGDEVYGLHWGDPDKKSYLQFVKQYYLQFYVNRHAKVVEIGPGGGRWTRYMLLCNRIYAVDYHQELLDELEKTYNNENIIFIKNNGTDFPGVPDGEIDFYFQLWRVRASGYRHH